MAKQFAKAFYNSVAWKLCRDDYFRQRHGLCERCLERGDITPGEIVHHIIPLTPDNIHDDRIALAADNLQLLCRECHVAVHADDIQDGRGVSAVRYKCDSNGRIIGAVRVDKRRD